MIKNIIEEQENDSKNEFWNKEIDEAENLKDYTDFMGQEKK